MINTNETCKGKGKGKFHLVTGHEGLQEQKYSSTLSLTYALNRSGWLAPRPGRLTPANRPSTHCRVIKSTDKFYL